jgi:two-component system response regulator MprA
MRILVVEDDLKVGAFLEQGLRDEDIQVDRAYDSPEALMRAGSAKYDLILLDYMLPTRSGIEVALELRAAGQRTPILMLTARDAPEDRKVGLAAGVTDFLGKPFRFDTLLDRINALVPADGRIGG